MRQSECVEFLQWCLPRLRMRWAGFRKVRSQVCKRLARRLSELEFDDLDAYRRYLMLDDEEWTRLDAMCRITISRFYRDRGVFDALETGVLPELAAAAQRYGERAVRVWSCGCASGEEPYSLRIAWDMTRATRPPSMSLEIVATDADPQMLDRARRAVYPRGSIRDLPPPWQERAFTTSGDNVVLRPERRVPISWICQDVRSETPHGRFDLVLCRNLVFTYYDEPLQLEIVHRLADAIRSGGALVVGSHETLPPTQARFEPWPPHHVVHRRRS